MNRHPTDNPLFSRSLPLYGEAGIRRLTEAKVAIFGLGGVGSYAAEALARAGVGAFLLVDGDCIEPSNLNRQLYALHSTLGRAKTELARERILDINPGAECAIHSAFVAADEIGQVLALQPDTDLILDAIDSVQTKVALITKAVRGGIPIFSSMGAGFRLDPTRVRCADLARTHGDKLARIMRRELKAVGIIHLPVVFSDEPAVSVGGSQRLTATAKAELAVADSGSAAADGGPSMPCEVNVPDGVGGADKGTEPPVSASSSLVPPAFGLALASLALRFLLQDEACHE
ncbi:MAG: tRNA threonylcarbamoyladenosine dehydratase [Clostridiales bacterium]|nr:tRNA threonylcarbamoyladenosine dehydratase [Clostridiales bacterium]